MPQYDLSEPYIGYRSAGRRPEANNDRTAAANAPLSALRGWAASTLGLPGDIEGLARAGISQLPPQVLTAFPALRAFGIGSRADPTPQLPTTEFYNEYLPGAQLNETPTGKAFTTAGNLLGGSGSTTLARYGIKSAKATGQALGPTAVRIGEDYLQRQGLMPGVVEGESAGMLGGTIKPQAPVSPVGFYSAAEQAALNIPRKSGTGESFLNDLMKGQDVKKEELSWMGLDDYLKGKPNVTRQEVQDFLANNRVDVQEVTYGSQDFSKLPDTQLQNEYVRVRGYKPVDNYGDAMSREEIINELSGAMASDLTRYSKYQLAGGENYREILLTLPGKENLTVRRNLRIETDNGVFKVMDDSGILKSFRTADEAMTYRAQQTRDDINKLAQKSENYRSSHFDEPNILAHMRVNDRVDADGKKMLLIEEIQSDWHQAGREKGYNTAAKRAEEQKKLDDLLVERQQLGERQKQLEELASPYTSQGKDAPRDILNEWNSVSNRLNRLQTEQNRLGRTFNTGVPDAPFKDTWHQLALKRALKYAADNGYDRVGLTTGRQQAERYDLSKQISKVMWDKETGRLTAYDKNVTGRRSDGRTVMDESGVTEEKLSDYIGKEAAQKLIKEIPNEDGTRFLSGLDLQIGGEGMKKYYDEIYPAFLAKQGKKYNAKTGETKIKTETNAPAYVDYIVGKGNFNDTTVLGVRSDGSTVIVNQNANSLQEAQQLANRYKEKHLGGGQEPIRYIDISPEMRGGVKKGQPLFTAAPIGGIGLGAGMQDNEMPDALRQELDLTGNLVLPEGGGSPIVLPDIYAEGGEVHMAKGGLVSSNHFDPIKIKQIIASLDDDYDPENIQQIIAQRESAYA